MKIYPPQPVPLLGKLDPKEYWAQPKFDGWRVVRQDGQFYTRHGNPLPPAVMNKLIKNCTEYDLDLELVSRKGRPHIASIRAGNEIEEGTLILLDVIKPDMPVEKRAQLAEEIAQKENIKFAPLYEVASWDDINTELGKAFKEEYGYICDGVILKKKGSLYPVSDLGQICFSSWIKVKNFMTS